jgi:hypothetical protein
LQDEADQLLKKAGGNPLMIRVLAKQLREAGDPLGPGNVSMWRNAVEDIKFYSQSLRLEDYSCHPKDAYRDTIKSIESQAQKVLAVLYRYFKPLQKVRTADLLHTWKGVIEGQGGSSREVDFHTGLDDLHFKNAVEHYQGKAFCPHGVHIDLSALPCAVAPEPPKNRCIVGEVHLEVLLNQLCNAAQNTCKKSSFHRGFSLLNKQDSTSEAPCQSPRAAVQNTVLFT